MTQGEALTILKTGANVFLTGEPGSGKSHTINQYVAYLRSCGIEPAITASTGIAATHIGGMTIHSWSGIGIRKDLTAYDLDSISQNKNYSRRIHDARILIIDEVSMLSARTLTMVDMVCREVRRSEEAFGGLQVVLVGDFFQLPPVMKRESQDDQPSFDDTEEEVFAFSSPAWKAMNPIICYLSEQHRQEDGAFLEFLSAVRRAGVVETHMQLLRTRYSRTPKDGITQLFSHNANVDYINSEELGKIGEEVRQFAMTGHGAEKLIMSLKRGCLSPEMLSLKIGARVMFTKNDITGHRFANGTLGMVTGFSKTTGFPIVKTNGGRIIETETAEWRIDEGGRILARISQVPLRLAWAMTVHKSQGMSLDAAHMDLSDTFEYGQGYVALSRVRTLSGLSLAGLNKRALEVHPEILEKDESFREKSEGAQEKFAALAPKEIETLHMNFLRACGGTPGKGRVVKTRRLQKGSTHDETKKLVEKKMLIPAIAKERGLTAGTIIEHLEKLVEAKKISPEKDLEYLGKPKGFEEMKEAFKKVATKENTMPLALTRALLNDKYSFDELRITRLFMSH